MTIYQFILNLLQKFRDSTYDALAEEPTQKIREICQEYVLTDEHCQKFMEILLDNINRGLKRDTHAESIVKCFVTYVQDLPDGNETGRYLALDLGGTNFRVLMIEFSGNHQSKMYSDIYAISQETMTGPGEQLFDHIASCLADFVKKHDVENEDLPLGFTFSFPCKQEGLTVGILERWTKGFSCSGVIGQDVVALLEAAMQKKNLKITCCGILNDTTGTLLSCAWENPDCKIGLIIGTGTNACYVEKVENAEMFKGDTGGKPIVLINTEWGAFGDDGALDFIRTAEDRIIDQQSINPGKQLHEKMISGMYLGELVRLVALKCIKKGFLFNGKSTEQFDTKGAFETKFISEIESEPRGTFNLCHTILTSFGFGDATDQDCANFRYICEIVSARAAHMCACGLSTLLNKINCPQTTVGIDGSLYRFHPKFHDLMTNKMQKLVKPGIKFNLMLSQDGSGRGAALVAAAAAKDARRNSITSKS